MQKAFNISFVILALLGFASFFYFKPDNEQVSVSENKQKPIDLPIYGKNLDQGLLYNIRYQSFFQINTDPQGDKGAEAISGGLSLSGKLSFWPYQMKHGNRWYFFNLTEAALDANMKQVSADGKKAVVRDLKNGAFVEVSSMGKIKRVVPTLDTANELSLNILKEIAMEGQLSLPEGKVRDYTTHEKDINGDYEASYRIKKVTDKLSFFEKQRKYFNNVVGEKGINSHKIQFSGLHNIVFNHVAGMIDKVDLEITRKITVNQNTVNNYSLKMFQQYLGEPRKIEYAPGLLKRFNSITDGSDTALDTSKSLAYEAHRMRISGKEYDQVKKRLLEIDAMEKPTSIDFADALGDLIAYYYTRPDLLPTALEDMMLAKGNSYSFKLPASALIYAGTKDAQNALSTLIDDTSADNVKQFYLMRGIGFVKKPELHLQEKVTSIVNDHENTTVKETAALALGTMGSFAGKTEPERSDDIVNFLEKKLVEENDLHYLTAIGNTGNEAVVSISQKYVESSSPTDRWRAVEAVRFSKSMAAKKLLLDTYIKDSESTVRKEAITSLGNRVDRETIQKQMAFYDKEKSPSVRAELLRNIWKSKTQGSQEFVKRAYHREKKKNMKNIIQVMLAERGIVP